MPITIHVNGSEREIDNLRVNHLDALVKSMVENDRGVMVELNETLIHRDRWDRQPLQEGDVIELINFVGGG
ncbi:MAG: sulfur carrier protein ThiS [bacterium]|nr:sulfur carrier protein ThiS [bacterium]